MKDEIVIPRKIWHPIPVSEIEIPFEIRTNKIYGSVIYEPTRKKSKKGYEFMLVNVKGNGRK